MTASTSTKNAAHQIADVTPNPAATLTEIHSRYPRKTRRIRKRPRSPLTQQEEMIKLYATSMEKSINRFKCKQTRSSEQNKARQNCARSSGVSIREYVEQHP